MYFCAMQFSRVVGQQMLKEHFIKEINSDKIGHAKLFFGQEGYGTLALALAYVQYLFCKNRSPYDSCGTCDACIKMKSLQHPDLHFSYPTVLAEAKIAKNILPQWREKIFESPYFDIRQWTHHIDPKGRTPAIGTDESMEIIKSLSLKPYERGGYKIMLIWCIELMNKTSANQLLKILEEPPAKTIFILICSNPEYLLSTILSRTQLTRIPRISSEDMGNYLQDTYHIPSDQLSSITLRAEGNLIRANELSDHTQQNTNSEWFIELMRVSYAKNIPLMIDWAEKLGSQTKEQQTSFLHYALHLLRQSLLKNYTSNELLRISEYEADFLNNFARFVTGKNILDFHELFNKAYLYIERNCNPKIIFTDVCFNVMRYLRK